MEQIVKLTNQTNGGMLAEGNSINTSKDYEKTTAPIPERNGTNSETRQITSELLDVFLYGKRKIQEINLEEAKRQKTAKDSYEKKREKEPKSFPIWCDNCRTHHTGACPVREPLKTMHQLVGTTVHDIKLTYAVLSFPDEVQLCTSSIPGYSYGVSAKQTFPIGTWIGPYEGKRIKSEEVTMKTDTNYVWEIYEEGKFSHYLDGNDESNSSWMRFIRCARHKGEQNMVVFQYGNNIYYRAVRDIPVGTELLVWYNNNYNQFLGVPLGLRNVPGTKKGQENTNPAQPASEAQTSPLQQTDIKPVLMEQSNGNNNQKVVYSRTPNSYGKSPDAHSKPPDAHSKPPDAHCKPAEGYSKPPDAYSKPPDGYSKPPEGYSKPPDAYRKPPEGYSKPPDAYSKPPDAHSKPPDGYSKPPEGYSKPPDAYSKPPEGYRKPPGAHSKPPEGYSKPHETVYSSRQMQTSTTYCYSASQPTGLPTPYTRPPTNNVKTVQPSVTIEHRPTVSEFTSSRNHTTSPGNATRQQYVTPYSGSSPVLPNDYNNNYFVFSSNQSPPAGSTSSVSIFHNDHPQNTPSEESNTWKCGQCLQTFNQRLLLQLHVCVPPSGKPYQCGHCSDSFSQPAELRSHVVTHSTDRPFKCGFCGRAFAGAATLNNHMRTHTGERPFLCQNCGRTFGIATQLSRHMRTPGECPMGANQSLSQAVGEFRSDVSPPPFTSTLTRG